MTDVLDRLEVLQPITSPPQPQSTKPRERFDPSPAALRVAASLSIAAGVIHLVMVPSHAGESLAEGVGFALAGWFQLVAAWLFLTRRVRNFLVPIAVANVLFIGAWVWSRTAGIPFGAHAGHAESAGFVDLTTVALEAALLLWCAILLRRPGLGRGWGRRARRGAALAIVAIFGLTTAAIASPSARDHAAHSHGATDDGHDHSAPVDDKGLSALSNGHHHAIGPEQPLDAVTRAELTHQISITQEVAKQYPTVAAAEAAGYSRAGPYSPGLGAHYIRPSGEGLNFQGVMSDDALRNPLSIIYAGTSPDSPIAGFMYYAMTPDAPVGFAGPNDVWHYHTNVCLKYNPSGGVDAPFGADSDVPPDLCTNAGGQLLQQTQWMVHVWSVPGWESQQGLFGEVNPALPCPDGTYYQLPQDQWPAHPFNVCQGT